MPATVACLRAWLFAPRADMRLRAGLAQILRVHSVLRHVYTTHNSPVYTLLFGQAFSVLTGKRVSDTHIRHGYGPRAQLGRL